MATLIKFAALDRKTTAVMQDWSATLQSLPFVMIQTPRDQPAYRAMKENNARAVFVKEADVPLGNAIRPNARQAKPVY